MLILVVEDDKDIREMVCKSLEQSEFLTCGCWDIQSAKRALRKRIPDCLVIDWMLPDGSGIDLVRWIRKQEHVQHLPILMLTSRAQEIDLLTGLDSGADDYLTKPMSLRELTARIKALLRRPASFHEEVYLVRSGSLSLNLRTHEVYSEDKKIELSKTEFNLLKLFMESPKTVFTREQILDAVWGINNYPGDRAVDVQIVRLRKLLKLYCKDGVIKTVRGTGYCLSNEVQ